jgi:hypothetical protein
MEVSAQLHASAILPPEERAPNTHSAGGRVGTRAGLDAVQRRKNFAPAGNQTSAIQPVAIPTELFRLLRKREDDNTHMNFT